ncbi:MAG: glycosyltransferase N-terminal domain-containing protein [Paracoccaceae bacterium]|nr:glycosyltransferase N-terminal domain-containing protein [Paracoccaceae bacterium]
MIVYNKLAEKISKTLYLASTSALLPMLPFYLRRRLRRGKENHKRWREKQGRASTARPVGKLIWLHAVGLGEVLALRGIIAALQASDPDLYFLVTSSTAVSGESFAKNQPLRTTHQFLPLDSPRYVHRFLDHWHPDLALWSEQDMWPGLVYETARRSIPQALINVRMTATSARRKHRVKALYRSVYRCFALISVQDQTTADRFISLGAQQGIRVDGSLKPYSPPLEFDPKELANLNNALTGKDIWLAASCHPEDEEIALAAHRILCAQKPNQMLILAPRNPDRTAEIQQKLAGFNIKIRSHGQNPDLQTQVYLADSFADMGQWYKLAKFALIGGTFSKIEGHNPWEALKLGCAVMHGPQYANFTNDFERLHAAKACFPVYNSGDIVDTISTQSTEQSIANFHNVTLDQRSDLSDLAAQLLALTNPNKPAGSK